MVLKNDFRGSFLLLKPLYVWILLLLFSGSGWSHAQATVESVLRLPDALTRALSDNPGLAEMQQRYEALTHIAPQKGSLPDPIISLNAANFPADDFDIHQENMTQLKFGVSQMFPFPGKLSLNKDIALFEAEAALHSVDEMRLNLQMKVAVTWWEIYFLDRSLETVATNQALLRQFVDIAKVKYKVGKGLQQDVLLAQLELSKLLDNEIRLKSMRELRVIRLNVLMNVSPDTPALLPVMMPRPAGAVAASPDLYRRAMENRPVLAQEEASISASESRLALAKKAYYPDFNLGVTYGNRQEDDFGRSRQDFLSVMLSLNIPLYAGTKQSQAVEQRTREVARDRYSLVDQKNLVYSTISNSLTDYSQAAEQLDLFENGIVPQARQTVESMLAGYQVNQVDFLNLVRSQVTLFNYELQYWKAFTELNQSIARLKAAVGVENIYE